jgi:hypothetical protein
MSDNYTYVFEVGAKFIYEGGDVNLIFTSNDSYAHCHDRISDYSKKLTDEGKNVLYIEIFHTAESRYLDVDYD